MKRLFFVVAAVALVIAGCYSSTGVRRPNPDNPKKTRPVVEVRDNGDSPEKIRAKADFLGVSSASELSADATLAPLERLTAAALARGEGTTRAFSRVLHEAGVGYNVTSTTTPAGVPAFTEVQEKWRKAGFVFNRGKWYAPSDLDPAQRVPLNESEIDLLYRYEGTSDYGPAKPVVDSIRAFYQ
ncbi:hypothetical protein GYA54_00070 [Candidatus Kuenenbacteria bacterium]|nr:hypothetical protein [Candidatus Kuenenbacteria bacterium]